MQNYKKILIKLSGEVIGGKGKDIFDEKKILTVAGEIAELAKKYQIVLFMGGGNIFRWRENNLSFLDRITGDWIGIKATILNGLIMSGALRNKYKCRVKMFTDHMVSPVFEKYNIKKARKYFSTTPPPRSGIPVVESAGSLRDYASFTSGVIDKPHILIIASCGKPGQTTDTGAVQKARDLSCDIILKGSKVEGVYSADPKKNKNAKFYSQLSYQQAIDEKLGIIDDKAFKICKENKIPITVFNLGKYGNIKKALEGEVGSIIHN